MAEAVGAVGRNTLILDGTGDSVIFERVADTIEHTLRAREGSERLFRWRNKSLLSRTHIMWQYDTDKELAEVLERAIPGEQDIYKYIAYRRYKGFSWSGFDEQREIIVLVGRDYAQIIEGLSETERQQ